MHLFVNNIEAWLAAALVALLTVFSDKIIGRIRLALNRSDLRVRYFEELAMDLSTYLFYVEVFHERHSRGWADDEDDLSAITGEINGAVATIRKKQYVYRSWVSRYWNSEALRRFEDLMDAIAMVEAAVHAFNDPGNVERKTSELGSQVSLLRSRVHSWLAQPDV